MSEKKKRGRARDGVNLSNIKRSSININGDIVGGDKINAGDISGTGINVGSGDQTIHTGLSETEITNLFKPIYQQIESRPEDPDVDKEEMVETVKKIQDEVTKGEEVNQNKVQRWLTTLGQMAPDILDVVTAAILSPATGIAAVVRKVAARAKEEAGRS